MEYGLYVPDANKSRPKWLVDGCIPLGGYCVVAAQPGVGKSWLLEALAMCVSHGMPFLGLPTMEGDVLLIDEDTPKQVASTRLDAFYHGYVGGSSGKHKLFALLMEGYRVSNGNASSLKSLIARPEYKNVRLIILDALVTLAGKAGLDNTRDAAIVSEFLDSISSEDRAVLAVHHISSKVSLTVSDAMTCVNPEAYIMNNTRLVSGCQGLYIVASPTKGGDLKELYVRPVSRRLLLPRPFCAQFIESDGGAVFNMLGEVMQPTDTDGMSKHEKRILSCFEPESQLSVKELDLMLEGYMHVNTLRVYLHKLEDDGILDVRRKGVGAAAWYSLTENKGLTWYSKSQMPRPSVSLMPKRRRRESR